MSQSVRHFYASGNTAQGEYHLTPHSFQVVQTLFLLQGELGKGKSAVMAKLAEELAAAGDPLELYHSPLFPEELDAWIDHRLQAGMADAAKCKGLESLEGVNIININFDSAADLTSLAEEDRSRLAQLNHEFEAIRQKAYAVFAEALREHDVLERIYIDRMDFGKANDAASSLIQTWLNRPAAETAAASSSVRRMFFGAATPSGAKDYIMQLTDPLEHRIFIKGRAGSGKSTVLKKTAAEARRLGYAVELYHCGFDPGSVDMLIIPELSLALFDSTAPHEHEPSRTGDLVLDMYELAIEPGTDERFAIQISEATAKYKGAMKQAIAHLAEAQKIARQRRALLAAATDFSIVGQWQLLLQSELRSMRSQG